MTTVGGREAALCVSSSKSERFARRAAKSLMTAAAIVCSERSQFHGEAIRRGEKRESEVPDNVSLSGQWCRTPTRASEYMCVNVQRRRRRLVRLVSR